MRTMTKKMYGAVVASVSAVMLMLAPTETFAVSGTAPHGTVVSRADGHRPLVRRFHRGPNGLFFWPGDNYEPSGAQPYVNVAPPSNELRYTYSYDVPWDWAHRFPPDVVPSDHPYVQGCPSEKVAVEGSGGGEQTVNITRCY